MNEPYIHEQYVRGIQSTTRMLYESQFVYADKYGNCNSGIQTDIIEQKKGERNPKWVQAILTQLTIDSPHPPSLGEHLSTRTKRSLDVYC